MNRNSGFKIYKGDKLDNLTVRQRDELPVIDINNFQAPTQGGLVYEPVTKKLYYADGTQWIPIGGGGTGTVTSITAGIGLNAIPNPITTVGTINMANTTVIPGTYGNSTNISQFTVDQQGRLTAAANIPISSFPGLSKTYSILKNGNQSIFPNVNTVLSGWSVAPSPPFSDNTGNWNLITGVYLASQPSTLNISVALSWAGGISNLGNRTVRIIYQPFAGLPFIAKESVTQADPNTNVATTQETAITLKMNIGDEAWIEVRHNAPINLDISGGNTTTCTGAEVKI